MARILMVAFHFPPMAGSSGIQRTLRFVQHLPALSWDPLVLSAAPRAYERTSDDLLKDIPSGVPIRRAFALDAARQLSVQGRYPGMLARPDRWATWQFDGVRQGLNMIRELKPDVIWSTFPIATAHVIAAQLAKRSGLPWIADFRDPMCQENYPTDPKVWRSFQRIESYALHAADYCTFTTPGAAREYRYRYPEAAARIREIQNGYDEEAFADASLGSLTVTPPIDDKAFTLLHSGIIYTSERDPTELMAALQLLHSKALIRPGMLKVRFRASLAETLLRELAERFGVLPYVELCPPISYREALAEMMRVDALLIMQASNCNAQIPAKLYEYLRAGRPIIALTDPIGDTAATIRAAGASGIADLSSRDAIAALLERMLDKRLAALGLQPSQDFVSSASRRSRTEELVSLLDSLTSRK